MLRCSLKSLDKLDAIEEAERSAKCNEPGFLVLDTKGTSVRLVRQGRCHYSRRVITDSY